jgi:ABC-type sugar transport system substrate-binding protein
MVRRAAIALLAAAPLAVGVAVFGGTAGSSALARTPALASAAHGAATGRAAAATCTRTATAAQVATFVTDAFGPGVTINSLPASIQAAYRCLAAPVTPQEEAKINQCMQESVCTLGSGTLSVGDLESNYAVPFRHTQRQEQILAALRSPGIGKFYFSDAGENLTTFLSNFRTMISEHVDVITGNWDFADSMLPLARQAIQEGLEVVDASTPFPTSATSADLSTEVVSNLCQLGTSLADAAVKTKKDGQIALVTGPPGNTYAAEWQPCAKKAIAAAHWTISGSYNTGWTPQGEQQVASAIVASGKIPDAIIYDYNPQAIFQKFLSLGKTPPAQFGGVGVMGPYKVWKQAQTSGHKFIFEPNASNATLFGAAVLAGVYKKQGTSVPLRIVLPQPVVPAQSLASQFSGALPAATPFNSGLPAGLLKNAFQS